MKIRTGFVSNSSSTSFAIVGAEFDENKSEIEHTAYELMLKYPEFSIYQEDYYTPVYVGVPLFRMNEDVTLREFKQDVMKKMNEFIPVESVSILSDGWYDG